MQAPPVAAAPQAEPFDWLPEADKPEEPIRTTPASRKVAREQHYRELNEQAAAPVQKPPMTEDEKEKVKEVVRSRASERARQIRQREEIARQVEKSPEKEAAEQQVVEGVKKAVREWQQPAMCEAGR